MCEKTTPLFFNLTQPARKLYYLYSYLWPLGRFYLRCTGQTQSDHCFPPWKKKPVLFFPTIWNPQPGRVQCFSPCVFLIIVIGRQKCDLLLPHVCIPVLAGAAYYTAQWLTPHIVTGQWASETSTAIVLFVVSLSFCHQWLISKLELLTRRRSALMNTKGAEPQERHSGLLLCLVKWQKCYCDMFIQASEDRGKASVLPSRKWSSEWTSQRSVMFSVLMYKRFGSRENLLKSTKTDAEMTHKQINKINSSSHFIFVEFSTLCGSRV